MLHLVQSRAGAWMEVARNRTKGWLEVARPHAGAPIKWQLPAWLSSLEGRGIHALLVQPRAMVAVALLGAAVLCCCLVCCCRACASKRKKQYQLYAPISSDPCDLDDERVGFLTDEP